MMCNTFITVLAATAVVSASPILRRQAFDDSSMMMTPFTGEEKTCFDCSCAKIVPDSVICNADRSQTVTVDFSDCKNGDTISWAACACGSSCTINSCDDAADLEFGPSAYKCSGTINMTVTVPEGATSIPIILHDGRANATEPALKFGCAAGGAGPNGCGGNGVCASNIPFTPATCIDSQPPVTPCTKNETAWATGSRYNPRGNWATYVTLTTEDMTPTVNLFAGQTHLVGNVTISSHVASPVIGAVSTKFDFMMADSWDLQSGVENIKIQPYYEVTPSGNPSPGLFACKHIMSGNSFTVYCPTTNGFSKNWGIHADVVTAVPCAPAPAPEAALSMY